MLVPFHIPQNYNRERYPKLGKPAKFTVPSQRGRVLVFHVKSEPKVTIDYTITRDINDAIATMAEEVN